MWIKIVLFLAFLVFGGVCYWWGYVRDKQRAKGFIRDLFDESMNALEDVARKAAMKYVRQQFLESNDFNAHIKGKFIKWIDEL